MSPGPLAPFLEWLQALPLAQLIRNSRWLLPAIETVHLLGYALLIGTILAVDFRMLGAGLRQSTAAQISRQLAPWTLASLVVTMATGVCLFLHDPLRFYENHSFPYKLIVLLVALGFHYTVHWQVSRKAQSNWTKPAAAISLVSWLAVALAGLAISLQPF